LLIDTVKETTFGKYKCEATNVYGVAEKIFSIQPIESTNSDLSTRLLASQNHTVGKSRQKRHYSLYHVISYNVSSMMSPLQEMLFALGRRILLADKVAISKWDSGSPIEDLPREELILQAVVKQAQDVGLSSTWATKFFRDQIEANKFVQRSNFRIWERMGRPDVPPVDLETEVRPIIDEINAQLISLAKSTEELRRSWKCHQFVEWESRYASFCLGLNYVHQKALFTALSNVCCL